MEIRQERSDDYNAVFQVVTEAFSHAEHSDGNEQELVTLLRATPSYIPELSLVAVEDGKIVGHILFTKITIREYVELALAPLSVLPAYQRRGIGLALIREGTVLPNSWGMTTRWYWVPRHIILVLAIFQRVYME